MRGDARPVADRHRPGHSRRADLPDRREGPDHAVRPQRQAGVRDDERPRADQGPRPDAQQAGDRLDPAALAEVATLAQLDPRPAGDPHLCVAAQPHPGAHAQAAAVGQPQPQQPERAEPRRLGDHDVHSAAVSLIPAALLTAEDPHDLHLVRQDGTGPSYTFGTLKAGGIEARTLDLSTGSWQLFYALPEHASCGMKARLKVTG